MHTKLDYKSSPAFLINRASHLLRQSVLKAMQAAGSQLSNEEVQLLIVLDEFDGAISVGEFAKKSSRDATTLTRQINGLSAKGFATRANSTHDRRVMLISLTEAGKQELDRVLPFFEASQRQALKNIPPVDVEALIQSLSQIRRNLSE